MLHDVDAGGVDAHPAASCSGCVVKIPVGNHYTLQVSMGLIHAIAPRTVRVPVDQQVGLSLVKGMGHGAGFDVHDADVLVLIRMLAPGSRPGGDALARPQGKCKVDALYCR